MKDEKSRREYIIKIGKMLGFDSATINDELKEMGFDLMTKDEEDNI